RDLPVISALVAIRQTQVIRSRIGPTNAVPIALPVWITSGLLKITGPNLFALDSRVSALGSNSLAGNFRHNWSNLCTRSQLNEHAPGEAHYAPLLYPTIKCWANEESY